jgi:hypothetical protein
MKLEHGNISSLEFGITIAALSAVVQSGSSEVCDAVCSIK